MIPKDLLEEWKHYEITGQVIAAMEKEKERLLTAMELGHFVNPSDMEETFGGVTKASGKMEGLNTFFEIIGGNEDED